MYVLCEKRFVMVRCLVAEILNNLETFDSFTLL